MAYKLHFSKPAEKAIAKLARKYGPKFLNQLEKALEHLQQDLTHPGLHVHPVRGWKGWKEAYINKGDRLIFRVTDVIQVAWVGTHEELDKQGFESALIDAASRFQA